MDEKKLVQFLRNVREEVRLAARSFDCIAAEIEEFVDELSTDEPPKPPKKQVDVKITAIHASSKENISFNFHSEGLADIEFAIIDRNGKFSATGRKNNLTSNLVEIPDSAGLANGAYYLEIVGVDTDDTDFEWDKQTFTITDAGTVDPDPDPKPDTPVIGNEFPEPSYPEPTKLNELDLDAIPVVEFPGDVHRRVNVGEVETPYLRVLKGDKVKAMLRHANQIPVAPVYSDPNYAVTDDGRRNFQGESPIHPNMLIRMVYQQNSTYPGMYENPRYDFDYREIAQKCREVIGETQGRLGRNDGKVGLIACLYDNEWPGCFGAGTNLDRALFVLFASEYNKAAHSDFAFSNYYQAVIQSWGTSRSAYYESESNGAFFIPVHREATLENGHYPEELYGKSVADFCKVGSSETYQAYEDRYPHGYVVKSENGEPCRLSWSGQPYTIERRKDWSRHWIANLAGVQEAYAKRFPDFKRHLNLGLYCMGGNGGGYEVAMRDLNPLPEYANAVHHWNLRVPIPKFHARGYAVLPIFLGINVSALWCNYMGTSSEAKEFDGTFPSDAHDFRPYVHYKRELVRLFNTRVLIGGQTFGMKDIMDGSEEYLIDRTSCRYSGVNKVPNFSGGHDPDGNGTGRRITWTTVDEAAFLSLNAVERKVMGLPFVYQIVNRKKRLIATLGIKAYTSDLDTQITTQFEGKIINTFRLKDDEVMIRIDQY